MRSEIKKPAVQGAGKEGNRDKLTPFALGVFVWAQIQSAIQ